MPPDGKKMPRQYSGIDKNNEALWALLAVMGMVVLMEVWVWVA